MFYHNGAKIRLGIGFIRMCLLFSYDESLEEKKVSPPSLSAKILIL